VSSEGESTGPVSEREKLEKLISSEQFDELMQVVGNKGWIAIWCCFSILIIALAWGFLGSIPIKVMGNGISMTAKGPHVIVTQIQGTIVEANVDLGEFVEKGDVIVKMENPSLELEIRQKRSSLASKENELQALVSRVEEEKMAKRASILKEMENAILSRKTTENNLAFYEKDLEAKKRLEKKGIVPTQAVQEAKSKLEQAKIDIQSYQATLVRLKADLDRSYRVEEVQAKLDDVGGARNDLERLLLQEKYLEIRADHSGKVLEVIVAPGDLVVAGAEIASIEIPDKKGEHLHYYATFAAKYGDLLDEGLPVEIEVSGVDPKLYGFLLGKTKFVSPYPVTMEEIKSEVRNTEIAAYLKGANEVVYSAVIELQLDPATKSGYAWSTRHGPPWQLSSGTIGKVKTIVERKPPIIYILPMEVSPYLHRLLSSE